MALRAACSGIANKILHTHRSIQREEHIAEGGILRRGLCIVTVVTVTYLEYVYILG